MRKLMCAAMVFLLVNMLFMGLMQVYKVSYNTMNSEKISMADISFDEKTGKTDIELMGSRFELDIVPCGISGHDVYMIYSLIGAEIREMIYIINDFDKLL